MRVLSPARCQRFSLNLAAILLDRCRWPISPCWLLLRLSDTVSKSTAVAHCSAEIRLTQTGFLAQTYVKGDRNRAIATAVSRLAGYISSHNTIGRQIRAARPPVLSEETPGRWLVHIGLLGNMSALRYHVTG